VIPRIHARERNAIYGLILKAGDEGTTTQAVSEFLCTWMRGDPKTHGPAINMRARKRLLELIRQGRIRNKTTYSRGRPWELSIWVARKPANNRKASPASAGGKGQRT
jgi:hypothetical protein